MKKKIGLLLFVSIFLAFQGAFAATSDDYYQAGKKLYAAQDYAKAVLYFGAAVKLDPNNVGALQGRGSCYYAQGQYQNALADFQQVQALRPSDGMAAFIEKVKAKVGAGSVASASSGSNPMAQGISLYQQKQYAQAVDAFEQATQQNPQDYRPFYYLGLSRLMSGDKRGAALSLSIANELHPNPGLASYAERLKATLSGDDQSWVQANLNSYDRNNGAHHAEDTHVIGLRLEPGLAMPALGDLNTDAKTQLAEGQAAQASDPSLQFKASVPAGYLDVTLEPTLKVLPFLELGLPIMIMPVGSYTFSESDSSGATSTGSYSISGFGVGVNARLFLGSGSLKPWISAGPIIAPMSLNYAGPIVGSATTITGNTSSMAIGGQVQLGADLSIGPDMFLSLFAGYRVLSASGFTGTFSANGTSANGEFYMLQSTYGYSIWAANQSYISSLSSSVNYRPLSIDLGGPILGIQGSLYF